MSSDGDGGDEGGGDGGEGLGSCVATGREESGPTFTADEETTTKTAPPLAAPFRDIGEAAVALPEKHLLHVSMMQKNFHEVDTSSGVAVHERVRPSSSPTSPSSSISTCSTSSSGSGSGSSTLSSSSRDDTSSGCCSSWDDDPNQNEKASLGLSDMLLPHGDGETPRDLLFPAGRRIDVDAVRCHYGISTYAEMIDLFRNLFQSYPFHPGEYVLAYSILGLGDEGSPLLLPVQPSDTILLAAGLYQVFVVSREVTVLPEGYDGVIGTNPHPRERY